MKFIKFISESNDPGGESAPKFINPIFIETVYASNDERKTIITLNSGKAVSIPMFCVDVIKLLEGVKP